MSNAQQQDLKPIAKAAEALNAAKEQLGNVAEATEAKVKEFPLGAVGLAFGAGLLVGAVGYALAKREPSWSDRIEDTDVSRKLQKLLGRYL